MWGMVDAYQARGLHHRWFDAGMFGVLVDAA
jgi:hypothetical protein